MISLRQQLIIWWVSEGVSEGLLNMYVDNSVLSQKHLEFRFLHITC